MYFRFMILDFYFKADGRVRTGDLRFTKPLLYQLSYIGNLSKLKLYFFQWAGKDLHLGRRKPADLQSAPFDYFGTCPYLGLRAFGCAPSNWPGLALRTRPVFPQTSFWGPNCKKEWSRHPGSNRGPHPYHGCALPTELCRRKMPKK